MSGRIVRASVFGSPVHAGPTPEMSFDSIGGADGAVVAVAAAGAAETGIVCGGVSHRRT